MNHLFQVNTIHAVPAAVPACRFTEVDPANAFGCTQRPPSLANRRMNPLLGREVIEQCMKWPEREVDLFESNPMRHYQVRPQKKAYPHLHAGPQARAEHKSPRVCLEERLNPGVEQIEVGQGAGHEITMRMDQEETADPFAECFQVDGHVLAGQVPAREVNHLRLCTTAKIQPALNMMDFRRVLSYVKWHRFLYRAEWPVHVGRRGHGLNCALD